MIRRVFLATASNGAGFDRERGATGGAFTF
jgi:hypothetical protein